MNLQKHSIGHSILTLVKTPRSFYSITEELSVLPGPLIRACLKGLTEAGYIRYGNDFYSLTPEGKTLLEAIEQPTTFALEFEAHGGIITDDTCLIPVTMNCVAHCSYNNYTIGLYFSLIEARHSSKDNEWTLHPVTPDGVTHEDFYLPGSFCSDINKALDILKPFLASLPTDTSNNHHIYPNATIEKFGNISENRTFLGILTEDGNAIEIPTGPFQRTEPSPEFDVDDPLPVCLKAMFEESRSSHVYGRPYSSN